MKTLRFFLLSMAAAVVAASCQKLETEQPAAADGVKLVPVTLTVGTPDDASTKTVKDGLKIKFAAGDTLVVFANESNATQYFLTTKEGGSPATFTGEVPSDFTAGRAFYPAKMIHKVYNATNIKISLAASQTGVKDGIDPQAQAMYACFDKLSDGFTMKQSSGLIKVSVAGEKVQQIDLTAATFLTQNDLNLNMTTGNISKGSGTTGTMISLYPESGKETFAPGDYYFSLVGKSSDGRSITSPTITYKLSDGSEYSKSSTNVMTIVSGAILNLGIDETKCTCTKQPVNAGAKVYVVVGETKTELTANDKIYTGVVDVPASGTFTLDIDGSVYGFVSYSGAGGLGTCNNENSALPYSYVSKTDSKKTYTVRKAMGTIGVNANPFWINNASAGKMNITVDTEKEHYYISMVEAADPSVILDETFDLLVYGGDYTVPCGGYTAPTDPWGVGTAGAAANTPGFNGAKWDGTNATNITIAQLTAWEVLDWIDASCIGYRPLHIQFGGSKSPAALYTPKFAKIEGTADVTVKMDINRMAPSTTGNFYIDVVGGGQIESGSMTCDGVEGTATWEGVPSTKVTLSDGTFFAHTGTNADVDKAVTHCTFKIKGATPETQLFLNSGSGNGRFQIFSLKVTK